jgi:hypothetical protein
VAPERGGEPGVERSPEQRVEAAGAFLHRLDRTPHDPERLAQGAAGAVIALIELGDEEEADAGVGGRHARKVIP